jgi:DNA-binding IclR family transcriptional regulator
MAVSSRDGTQTIRRAAAFLREVASFHGPGVDLYRLSRSLDLSRSTAYRMLSALTEEGFLVKEGSNYSLGPTIAELGLFDISLREVTSITRPILHALATELQGYAVLNLRRCNEAICIDCCDRIGPPSPKRPLATGKRRPLGVGAASISLLTKLSQNEVAKVVELNSDRYERFHLDTKQVLEATKRAKSAGYAMSAGLLLPTYRIISVSFLINELMIASVSVAKHSAELLNSNHRSEVLDRLSHARSELEDRLSKFYRSAPGLIQDSEKS